MARLSTAPIKEASLPRWGLRLSERRALLLAGDLLCALTAARCWRCGCGPSPPARTFRWSTWPQAVWFAVLVPGLAAADMPLYDLRRAAFPQATLAGLALLRRPGGFDLPGGSTSSRRRWLLPRLVALYFIVGAACLQWAWRLVYIRVLVSAFFRRRALVVGAGWAGQTIIHALKEFQAWHYEIVG